MRRARPARSTSGSSDDTCFTFTAGIGLDAEIMARMEQARAAGKSASPTRYPRDDPAPVLRRLRPQGTGTDHACAGRGIRSEGVFLVIIQNTSPWTYFGAIPINLSPGVLRRRLGLWGTKSLKVPTALRYGGADGVQPDRGSPKPIIAWHDMDGVPDHRHPAHAHAGRWRSGRRRHRHHISGLCCAPFAFTCPDRYISGRNRPFSGTFASGPAM